MRLYYNARTKEIGSFDAPQSYPWVPVDNTIEEQALKDSYSMHKLFFILVRFVIPFLIGFLSALILKLLGVPDIYLLVVSVVSAIALLILLH